MARRIPIPPFGMDYEELECFEERQDRSNVAAQRMVLVELIADERSCALLHGRLNQSMIALPDSLGRH